MLLIKGTGFWRDRAAAESSDHWTVNRLPQAPMRGVLIV